MCQNLSFESRGFFLPRIHFGLASKVDKQIRKLDADLARFEAEIKEQSANSAGKTSETPKYRRLHIYAIVSD